jgi:hypothetical protein
LPTHAALKSALTAARNRTNGGFNLDMWVTVINRDGEYLYGVLPPPSRPAK